MQQIPEKHLRACLAVVHAACLRARLLGYEGENHGLPAERCKLLADLMDAVHNLPDLVTRWRDCDESLLRGMLEAFDTRWAAENIGLLAAYERVLATDPA